MNFFKHNESEYVEKVNVLESKLYVKENVISELTKRLKQAQKKKDAAYQEKKKTSS